MIEDPGVINVPINLSQLPAAGTEAAILVRLRSLDKTDVDKAAQMIGLKQSEFIRACVVLTARRVISEFSK